MTTIRGTSETPTPSSHAAGGDKAGRGDSKILDAAKQFESLLIAQLLKTMREASADGWLGTGGDQAGARAMELAEEQLAQNLARQGGLGLANLVVSGLQAQAAAGQAARPSPSAASQKLQP